MFLNLKVEISLLLILHSFANSVLSYRVVCVYTNWSQYRPDKGKFLPENVDPSLCTHLIYVYAKLKGNQLEPSEWNDDGTPWSEGMYRRVNNLKQLNPDLKTLLGVGGWNMGSRDFSRMASRKTFRDMFTSTTVEFLRSRDFDGLAIDWQYPTQRKGRRTDRKNFSLLLKEIQEAFVAESVESGLPKLMLAAGVSASIPVVDKAYEVEKVSNYTDFLNVMAYDLHGSWDNVTGHPSPLFPRKNELGPQSEINVDSSMKHWISKGAEPSKLVLGVSTYGRTYTLRNIQNNGYGATSKSPGDAGDYTKQPGMLAFYERCSLYYDATRVWDEYSKVPYWFSGTQWIGGEDTQSIREKVNWISSNELGGMMIWSLDTDDFDASFCGDVSFPLLSAVVNQIAAPSPIVRPADALNNTKPKKPLRKPLRITSRVPKIRAKVTKQDEIIINKSSKIEQNKSIPDTLVILEKSNMVQADTTSTTHIPVPKKSTENKITKQKVETTTTADVASMAKAVQSNKAIIQNERLDNVKHIKSNMSDKKSQSIISTTQKSNKSKINSEKDSGATKSKISTGKKQLGKNTKKVKSSKTPKASASSKKLRQKHKGRRRKVVRRRRPRPKGRRIQRKGRKRQRPINRQKKPPRTKKVKPQTPKAASKANTPKASSKNVTSTAASKTSR